MLKTCIRNYYKISVIQTVAFCGVITTRNINHFKRAVASPLVYNAQALLPNTNAPFLSRNMAQSHNIKNIGVGELKNYQKDGTLIIDVREKNEIAETGILPGGINIPLGEVASALSKSPEDFEATFGHKKPDKDTAIVFSCRSGKRSMMASQKATELGFNNVLNFDGGWLAWEKQTKG